MQIGEAFVAIRPDTSKFGSELTRETETAGRQASSGLSQALTAGVAVAGFSKLIGSASALQQAIGGTTAVFGESSAAIDAWAENSADAVGLSEASYRELASFAGNQLKGLGFSTEEAAEQTNRLIEMGADLAATYGGTTQEAVQALSATFRGEYDPVEKYVAGLRASTVAAKAVEMGLADSGGAIDNYARGQATLALLTEGSADSLHQFSEEADTAAGQQQRAAAAAENSAAAIGENFLPVYNQAVGAVTALAEAFGALPGPLQTAAVGLVGYVALRAPIVAAFGSMGGSVTKLKTGLTILKGAFLGAEVAGSSAAASMVAAAGPWAALAAILVAVHTGVIDLTNALTEQEMDTQNVDAMTAAMTEAGSATEGLVDFLSDTGEFDPSFFDAMGVSVDTFAAALLGGEAAWDAFVAQVMGNLPEGADLGSWNEALETHRTRAQASADAMGEQEGASRRAALGLDENATAAEENAAALDVLSQAVDDYLDKIQGTEEANAAAAEAQQALFEALVQNGHTFDINTAKGRENISARNDWVDSVAGQVQAAFDYAAANGNVEVAQRRADNAVRNGVRALREAKDQGLITGAQFRALAGDIRGIPNRIDVDGGPARREATNTANHTNRVWGDRRFLAHLDADERDAVIAYDHAIRLGNDWAGRIYEAHFNARMAGGIPGQATETAMGGHRSRGQVLLVGEQGPEIFVPDSAGTVIPNHRTGGGGIPIGGGMTVVVNVEGNVVGDVDRFADEIAFRAAEKISRGAI